MQLLYNFISNILESSLSDDSVYYKIGLHKYYILNSENKRKKKEKYNIAGSHFREGIIQYIKDITPRILPSSKELIPRKDWDLKNLWGETEYQLMHPHYWLVGDFLAHHFKRKHDILTIFECANKKPYASQPVYKNNYTKWYRGFSDMLCNSWSGLVPMEYCNLYPYRYVEWNHGEDKPDITNKFIWNNIARVLKYKKAYGYKHIIVCMNTKHHMEWALKMYKENIEGCKDWLHIVLDDQFRNSIEDKMLRKFDGNKGIMTQRLLITDEVRDRYARILKSLLSTEEKKAFNKIQSIQDIDSSDEKEEALNKFNEEYHIEPYDMTIGFKEKIKKLDPYDYTTQEAVDKNKNYLKQLLQELPDHYKQAQKDKHYHTHRVIFTVLDLVMDQVKNKIQDDPDIEYWNMHRAIHEFIKDNKNDIVAINSYCFCYKPLINDISINKVKNYTDSLGITQFDKKDIKKD